MKIYKLKLKGEGHQMLMSPDQKIIAVAGGSVRLFSSLDGKQLGENITVLKYPHYLAFSHDSRFLAIKNTSGHIAVFDTLGNCIVCKNKITNVEGCGIYFTPDDKYIVTGDWDGNILIFDWTENRYRILKKLIGSQRKILINNIQYIYPDTFIFMVSPIYMDIKVILRKYYVNWEGNCPNC